ncbi:unnamed protein product, partial [Mesorhabditis spiculigera]
MSSITIEAVEEIRVEDVPRINRPRVHIDERLEQRWRNLGHDSLNLHWKRGLPAGKMVDELIGLAEGTINSMQTTTARVRDLTDNMCRLENLVGQLELGSQQIPLKLESSFRMPAEFE